MNIFFVVSSNAVGDLQIQCSKCDPLGEAGKWLFFFAKSWSCLHKPCLPISTYKTVQKTHKSLIANQVLWVYERVTEKDKTVVKLG